MLAEYARHLVIASPLEGLAHRVRAFRTRRRCRRHPEIAEALAEGLYVDGILREFVRDGADCVDAGAHLGAVLSAFARLSPRGRHVAVEPTPYKARWLRRKFPGAQVVEAALTDAPGTRIFYHRPRASAYSGLRVQGSAVGDAKGVQEFSVRCARLDDLVGDRRVRFLKIDVEGAELLALRGATRVLDEHRPPILIECTRPGLDAFGFRARDVHDLLTVRHGYEMFIPRPAPQRGDALDLAGFERAMTYPFKAWNFLALPR